MLAPADRSPDVDTAPLEETAMSQVSRSVFEAIERWEGKALITHDFADRLKQEVVDAAEAGTVRLSQYIVAGTAAVVTLIAGGVFLDWAWPRMDDAMRTLLLAAVGLGVHVWGIRLESARRWVPASLLMQTAGLGLLMTAAIFSEKAWPDLTAGGIAAGIAGLLVPAALAPRTLRRNLAMPAVHLCFALGFVALFLDRATRLQVEGVIWSVDAVLVIAAAAMVLILRKDPDGERHPWALNAFVMAVYAAAVLIVVTCTEALGMEDDPRLAYPLDFWLLLVACLTLWGIHRSPLGLRREWFEGQLAWCVLLWVPLGFFTAMEALDGGSELALILVGSVAVLGFAYAMEYRSRRILATSALAFILAVWFWAADRGGALGVVAGLAFAAAFLFWLSGRVGAWWSKKT